MDTLLKWNDKAGLKKYADNLFKTYPELNEEYPTRRNKPNTCVMDFKDIEAKAGAGLQRDLCLNKIEREAYKGICVTPNIESLLFNLDFQPVLEKLTNKQKFVFDLRIEGNTQQEVSETMNISRKNVVKHLRLIKNKIIKYWKAI